MQVENIICRNSPESSTGVQMEHNYRFLMFKNFLNRSTLNTLLLKTSNLFSDRYISLNLAKYVQFQENVKKEKLYNIQALTFYTRQFWRYWANQTTPSNCKARSWPSIDLFSLFTYRQTSHVHFYRKDKKSPSSTKSITQWKKFTCAREIRRWTHQFLWIEYLRIKKVSALELNYKRSILSSINNESKFRWRTNF